MGLQILALKAAFLHLVSGVGFFFFFPDSSFILKKQRENNKTEKNPSLFPSFLG